MKISQLPAYQSQYITVDDLQGRSAEVAISSVSLESLWAGGASEEKITLAFKDKTKRLVLSKTRAKQMAEIAGDETDNWPGVVVKLVAGKASNGKATIMILQPGGAE
jgi:hypothetical protein